MNRDTNHHRIGRRRPDSRRHTHKQTSPASDLEIIVFGGPPVSGKGTQSEAFGAAFSDIFALFVLGKVFRQLAEADPNNPIWKPIIDGNLMPDEDAISKTFEWILQQRTLGRRRVMVDGFPRTVKQLELFMNMARQCRIKVTVIWFTTPIEECFKRPPRPERPEDKNPKTRWDRLVCYKEQTEPILAALPDYGITVEAGNLLLIDNTHITKLDVTRMIIPFLGLDCGVEKIFPETPGIASALPVERSSVRLEAAPRMVQPAVASSPNNWLPKFLQPQ